MSSSNTETKNLIKKRKLNPEMYTMKVFNFIVYLAVSCKSVYVHNVSIKWIALFCQIIFGPDAYPEFCQTSKMELCQKKLTGFSTYFRKKTTSELFDRVPNKSLIREKSENSLSIFAAELVIRKEKHFKSFLQRFSDWNRLISKNFPHQ